MSKSRSKCQVSPGHWLLQTEESYQRTDMVHKKYTSLLKNETRLCFGWRNLLSNLLGSVPACTSSFRLPRPLPASFLPSLVKGVYLARIFKVTSERLTHRATPTRRRVEGQFGSLRPPLSALRHKPGLETLTPPGRDLAAARSPPGRRRCGLAGCVGPAIWARRPAPPPPPPPHVQPLLGAVAPIRLNVRRGAGHGGCCGGDARVPGGAETAAERAADPGVRPRWACGQPGAVPSLCVCCSGSLPFLRRTEF